MPIFEREEIALRLFRITRPPALPEGQYLRMLRAASAVGATAGVQASLLGILVIGPRMATPQPADVSFCGRYWILPEWELPPYFMGCVWAVVLSVVLALLVTRGEWAARSPHAYMFLLGALAAASCAVFTAVCLWRLRNVPNVAILAGGTMLPLFAGFLRDTPRNPAPEPAAPLRFCSGKYAWDAGFGLLIAALVCVPHPARLAGSVFSMEGLNHWDHFVMFPALHYQHGARMAVDFYVLYGVGWPLLFSWLDPLYALDYGHLIGAAVCIGIVYYLLLYLCLRLAVGDSFLALSGVLLALALTVFNPILANDAAIWQAPSTTPLRAPLDVLAFACLWRHLFTGRARWLICAGALTGLSLLLTTDTGMLLCGVLMLYGGAYWLVRDTRERGRTHLFAFVAAVLSAGSVWFAGMAFASRGTLLVEPMDYLRQWVAGIRDTGASGVGAFRFLQKTDALDVFWFLLMSGTFLLAVSGAVFSVLQRKRRPGRLIAGLIGVYGLGRLTMFVWRTVPVNLLHGVVPFAVLLCLCVGRYRRACSACEMTPAARRAHVLFRAVALVLPAALLFGSPTFRNYPGLFQKWAEPESGSLCLYEQDQNVCGIAPEFADEITDLRSVIARIQALARDGFPPAVLDNLDSVLCHGAGIAPWARVPRFFLNTFTRRDQALLAQRLQADPPPAIIIRAAPAFDYFADTWKVLHDALPPLYRLEDSVGGFEVWRRRPPAPI